MTERKFPQGSRRLRALPEHLEDRGERGVYSRRNRLNDLTGREWVFATRSVINRVYPPSLQHELRSRHGGQKPPELCRDLIAIFTKPGERVLDPFMGVGGTLLGASLAGRSALGVEINPEWTEVYREVCQRESLPYEQYVVGDAREVVPTLPDESFDFILTDVPYWRMDTARRSTGTFKRAGEAAQPLRGSRLSRFTGDAPLDKADWLDMLAAVLVPAGDKLRPRRYMAVFIGDMYQEGRYHFLSADLAGALDGRGLVLKANLVWYDTAKRLHLYGYQYEFIPSMVHQNILVFRKEA